MPKRRRTKRNGRPRSKRPTAGVVLGLLLVVGLFSFAVHNLGGDRGVPTKPAVVVTPPPGRGVAPPVVSAPTSELEPPPDEPATAAPPVAEPTTLAPVDDWQAVPDPPVEDGIAYDPSRRHAINFRYADGIGEGSLLRSDFRSPFVAIRPLRSTVRSIVDVRDGSVVAQFPDRVGNERALSSDGGIYAVYQPDRQRLEVFETRPLRRVGSLDGLDLGDVQFLRIPCSRRLVCVARGRLTSWSLPDLKVEATVDGDSVYIRNGFSPGGRYVAQRDAVSGSGPIVETRLLDLETGTVAGKVRPEEPPSDGGAVQQYGATFSPDGRELGRARRTQHRVDVFVWSMVDGSLTDHFVFENDATRSTGRSRFRGYRRFLQWFPEGRRLLLDGRFVLDREIGGLVAGDPDREPGLLVGGNAILLHLKPQRGVNLWRTEPLPVAVRRTR